MQRQTRPPTSDGGHAAVGTSSGSGTGSSAVAGGGGGALEDGDSGTGVGSVGGSVGGAEYDPYGPAAGDHTATRPAKSAPHARQVHSLYASLATIADVLETPSLEG